MKGVWKLMYPDHINDIPLRDFIDAINKNIKEGNNTWVEEALKKFIIVENKAILKRINDDNRPE